MAYIRQVAPGEAVGVLKRVYDAAMTRAGGIAGIIKVMSLDGPSTQGAMQFYVTIMQAKNALDRPRKEMLATVVSNVNDCYY